MASNSAPSLEAALDAAISRYEKHNTKSKALHEEAVKAFPGGNTRTVLHTSPFPVCIKSGIGYQLTSEDGDTYTDLLAEFTAALYGHSNPVILSAISDVLQNIGMNVSATTAQEQRFAVAMCERFSLERVRFTNSGTEANLHALAAAKLFTKKRRVVSFGGGYHGGVLGFAGGKPSPNNVDPEDWIVARYNDLNSAVAAIKNEGVAAVILEAMQGSGGCINGTPDFLQGVRKAAREAGVLVILDEVMTSRISPSGLAGMLGLEPDLKTFGKYLGGGLAFGAFGGRADIMAVFDPRLKGSVAHSGTFNNNTLVTHAGCAGLEKVYTPEVARGFTEAGNHLLARLNQVTQGTKMCFTGQGTLMACHFPKNGARTIHRGGDVEEVDALKDLFWFEMLEQGFWMARRGFMALILDTPQSELDRFVAAVETFVSKNGRFLAIE